MSMRNKKEGKSTSLYLPTDQIKEVKKESKKENRNFSNMVSELITLGLTVLRDERKD